MHDLLLSLSAFSDLFTARTLDSVERLRLYRQQRRRGASTVRAWLRAFG